MDRLATEMNGNRREPEGAGVDARLRPPEPSRSPLGWSIVTGADGEPRPHAVAAVPETATRPPIGQHPAEHPAGDWSDAELVRLARQDREAFGWLYDRYVARIHGYCYRRLGNREAAEDATSQTFVRALTGLHTHRDNTAFGAWLFTIAERVMIDGWRRDRFGPMASDVPERADTAPTPEEAVLLGERRDHLRNLLHHLPDDQRRAIELRLADLTGSEVAQVMGRPTGAVKMLQFRAITTLRRLMGATPDESEANRDRR